MLDFNLVKKKFFEKHENDQKAAIGVRCVLCFVGPPPTFLASPATLNLFDNPGFCSVRESDETLSHHST